MPHLSPREKEIIDLICKGKTDKQIAEMLCIAYQTVRTYLSEIYYKTGCSNRTNLAIIYLEIKYQKLYQPFMEI